MTVTVDWLSTPPLKKHLLQTSSPSSPTPFKFQKRTLDHCPPTKNAKLKRKSLESNVHRYTVLEQNKSIVRVMDIDGDEHTLLLKDDWAELRLDIGTQINVIHTNYVADNPDFLSKSQAFSIADESISSKPESQIFGGCVSSQRLEDFHISASKNIIVDNQKGFLVVDPDRLISATTVSDSFACPRKTILNQKISASSYNWSLLKGTLLHSLFQARHNLCEELAKQLSKNWDSLYALDLNETQVTEILVKELGLIKQWYAQNPNIEVVDIEQRLWSFDYGLKGNVDVTVKQGQQLIPLELKTGRQHYSHRAQTSLYSMMMSNYNTQKLSKGILVYLNTVETIEVGTNLAEQRGLILGRNRLVSGRMPPMIENLSTCKNCYVKQECALYAKAMEADKKYHVDTMNFIEGLTFGMKQTHFDFLRYWEELISVEENSKVSVKKEAIGDLCLESVENLNSSDSKFNYRLKFTGALYGSDKSFLDSNIGDGDPIVLSQGHDRNPIALGYVSNISSDSLWIYTDKNVERQKSNHSIASNFRIATDIYSNNLGVIRGAIYNLFTPNGKFREFIVDLIKPEFSLVESSMINTIREFLNTDQQNAILNALASHSYSLILGMPGTGKTTTISYLVKLLVSMGKSVLLTSYTHSAVDNILLKLTTIGVDFLRLGAYGKIHPSIRTQMLDMRANLKTYSDLKDYYDNIKVVATTAMGFNHMLFTKKRFDYCIIDESSQMALPFCLTPLNLVNKFVLVGDQYQLSPLFAQKAANPAYSLFEHLSAAHPISVSKLSIQYRMNEDIMQLANELVYDNRLKCNAEKVRYSSLDTPNATSFLNKLHQSSNCIPSGCWIIHLLNPQNRVIFFGTDALAAEEQKIGSWIENPMELKLVVSAVEALVGSGVLETDIGIISPYKYQLKLLRLALNITYPKIELLTVDQFQGRDKKVILISFVRSNPQKHCGDLVRDWRRVNVAVTRAERKLVLVGSQNTLSESCSFQTLFKLFKEKKWVNFD